MYEQQSFTPLPCPPLPFYGFRRGSNKDKSKSVFELMADDRTLMTRALNKHKLSVDLYKYALAHACMQYYYFKERPSIV